MHMTGGEAVVRSLTAHNVSTVFGIPGTHNLAVYDALREASGIRHILARHEQGAAFMADGYARVSGQVGVCLSTTGPAALNTLASLGTAFSDSSPVLCIASQIPAAGIGLDKGFLHECSDQLASFGPVTKWSARADTVAAIPDVMREAFARMQADRPRPAAVEVPCDVLDAFDDVTIPEPAVALRPEADEEQIEQAARLLREARRPVIWAGGGVITSDASAELKQLAERLQAPIFTTVLGKGAIADDHPLAAGSTILHPAAREFLDECDLMLAVGTRFTEEETDRWGLRLPDPLIHIDIDREEIDRNYPATVGVVGDARASLRQINAQMQTASKPGGRPAPLRGATQKQGSWERAAEVAGLRQRILSYCQARAPEGVELVQTLRAALPRETIVVSDLTVAAYWCRRLLDIYEPRTNVYPWGFCTLGFGLPAAIGAKVARPESPVVVLCGDGGFLFNCQELAAAVQFNVPIVVLVFNDSAYGVLRPQQEMRYGGAHAVDLVNPDFIALARAFGVEGCRVTSIEQLGPAVAKAIEADRITLIELPGRLPWPIMEPWARMFDAQAER